MLRCWCCRLGHLPSLASPVASLLYKKKNIRHGGYKDSGRDNWSGLMVIIFGHMAFIYSVIPFWSNGLHTHISEREREREDSNSSFHFCLLPIVNFFNFSINMSQLPGQMTPAPRHPRLPWHPWGRRRSAGLEDTLPSCDSYSRTMSAYASWKQTSQILICWVTGHFFYVMASCGLYLSNDLCYLLLLNTILCLNYLKKLYFLFM